MVFHYGLFLNCEFQTWFDILSVVIISYVRSVMRPQETGAFAASGLFKSKDSHDCTICC